MFERDLNILAEIYGLRFQYNPVTWPRHFKKNLVRPQL